MSKNRVLYVTLAKILTKKKMKTETFPRDTRYSLLHPFPVAQKSDRVCKPASVHGASKRRNVRRFSRCGAPLP
jgi:hypothetical protein